jgi:hypothetical protein
VFAQLARAKIEPTLANLPDIPQLKVGVLSRNSCSRETEPPIAIVAEFDRAARDAVLAELHRLAWNFSHSPTVVTIEPHLMRVWTCCEPPENRLVGDYVVHELPVSALASPRPSGEGRRAVQVLHWANLVSGQFFRDRAERFSRDQRADHMLLANLKHLRGQLRRAGLTNDDICHDLLARVIFVQFLFDRKDSAGKSALNADKLASLNAAGVLRAKHGGFADVLEDHEETYRLFDWLDQRFNGDLFPSKGDTHEERQRAWREEKSHVTPSHLRVLRDFVRGDMDMPTGQRCLWPQYAFDAIPLDFISSIYEAFVTERARSQGIYYTPPPLVDFMLDRVLPWDGHEWDLQILDPACGSGVFLVKAFQRLIHRWKNAHPGADIRAETLRTVLERNLFGVDKDPHAVRVASFSLYLAMCDEIDPKYYWTQVHFPPMRQRRLIHADFFDESQAGFSSKADGRTYDLVIGNAPWGEDLLTPAAKEWASDSAHRWPVANKGIGTLFLPKAASLTKAAGKVAMIQSASSLLFNRSGPARRFREKFFTTAAVHEVVNLSALRFKVFSWKTRTAQKSVAPSCVVIFSPSPARNEPFAYLNPKGTESPGDELDLGVDPADVKFLHPDEASRNAWVWTALMWGNNRDWCLVRHLAKAANLQKLRGMNVLKVREGIIPSAKGSLHPGTKDRLYWEGETFPDGTFVYLNTSGVPRTKGVRTHRETALLAFELPQLTIKQGWQESRARFAAALTPSEVREGVLFTQSYLSVHCTAVDGEVLEAACLAYNSILAVYFLLLTSSRFSSYRPEPLVNELLRVPVPEPRPGLLAGVRNYDYEEVDRRVKRAFDFKDSEWVLVEDLFNVTLPDFKGDGASPGRLRTRRRLGVREEPELRRYCEYFVRVLKAGFGQDKKVCATIFQETEKPLLPYRLVAIHLNRSSGDQARVEPLDPPALLRELEELDRKWLRHRNIPGGNVYSQRIVRVYDSDGTSPTVYIMKPDAYRYWTRSMGLHDADEVAADFARWQAAAGSKELAIR